MVVEMIYWSISTKVWDRAGIELATPYQQSDTLPTALRGPAPKLYGILELAYEILVLIT